MLVFVNSVSWDGRMDRGGYTFNGFHHHHRRGKREKSDPKEIFIDNKSRTRHKTKRKRSEGLLHTLQLIIREQKIRGRNQTNIVTKKS